MVNILGVMIDFYYYLRVGVRKESLELFRIDSLYIIIIIIIIIWEWG